MLLLILLACNTSQPEPNHGWTEVNPPRPDLQCWRYYGNNQTMVCAPSLTSTHGASK